MKIHFYQDKRGEWRWRMVSRNGMIVASSRKGYTRKHGAKRAATAVVKAIVDAYFDPKSPF